MSQLRATPQRFNTTSSSTPQPQLPTPSPSHLESQISSGSSDYGSIKEEDIDLFSYSTSPQSLKDLPKNIDTTTTEEEDFGGSDYGELEFEDDREIEELLSGVNETNDIQDAAVIATTDESERASSPLPSPDTALHALATDHDGDVTMSQTHDLDNPSVTIQYDDDDNRDSSILETRSSQDNPAPRPQPPPPGTKFPNILTAFTTKLSKLSVTDLSSPSWCEQQFIYDLSTHGHKPATAAMKAGTAVHEALESELQQSVMVHVSIPEEEWGLKFFNTIQGLHALRWEGVTREVPVYGIHRNRVIMGIIDELRIVTPGCKDADKEDSGFIIPEGTTYPYPKPLSTPNPPPGVVQLTDHKTRQKSSVPSITSSSSIPAKIQMMTYHHLLSNLPNIDISHFGRILNLDVDRPFTDSFLVKIGTIAECSPFPTTSTTPYSLSTFLSTPTIRGFHQLLTQEYPLSISALSPSLRISYRSASTSALIANKFVNFSAPFFTSALDSAFDLWEAKRPPTGVGVADVWKCKFCEFIDSCEWRAKKAEEDRERARQRREEEQRGREMYGPKGVSIGEAMRQGEKGMGLKEAMMRELGGRREKKKRYEEREWWEGNVSEETEAIKVEAVRVREDPVSVEPEVGGVMDDKVITAQLSADAGRVEVQHSAESAPKEPHTPERQRARRRTKAEMAAHRTATSPSASPITASPAPATPDHTPEPTRRRKKTKAEIAAAKPSTSPPPPDAASPAPTTSERTRRRGRTKAEIAAAKASTSPPPLAAASPAPTTPERTRIRKRTKAETAATKASTSPPPLDAASPAPTTPERTRARRRTKAEMAAARAVEELKVEEGI